MLCTVIGTDQFGKETSSVTDIKPSRRPPFFWLGSEAEWEPKTIDAILPAEPQFVHEYRHISCGYRLVGDQYRWFEERA